MIALHKFQTVIEKWKLNHGLLASRLGIPKSSFSHKLSGRKYYAFTQEEIENLGLILKELKKDIGK